MTLSVLNLAASPGSGRRDLMLALVGELTRRGLRVSAVIGADDVDGIDKPGKDSHRHREAGAGEVMVTSAKRWALIHGDGPDSRDSALAHLRPVDLVITEETPAPTMAATGDRILDSRDVPPFESGDVPAIADFVASHFSLTPRNGDDDP
jgi:molybdopterin-guanine dinucleotide biosynthesis protein